MQRPISDMIDNIARTMWEYGGRPQAAIMPPVVFAKLGEEWAGAMRMVLPGSEGGLNVTKLHTDYGEITIITDPHCPQDKIYMGSLDQMRRIAEDTDALYAK